MTGQQGQANGHDLGALGDLVLQSGGRKRRCRVVTLSEMFNLLCMGGTKYIRRERPDIRPETIALGRAWLIAARPDLYDTRVARNQSGDLRLLVDENLPAKIIPTIRNGFGYATHTNFTKRINAIDLRGCGNSGTGDKPVWQWAVNNNIDAIITLDRAERKPDLDLTRIAKDNAITVMRRMVEEGREIVNMADLPVIIHVICRRHDYKYVSGVINNQRAQLYKYLQTRTAPVVIVDERGVRPDQTYLDLWKQHLRNVDIIKYGHERIGRRDARVRQWWDQISHGNPVIPPHRRDEIFEMLRRAAEIYKSGDEHPPLPKID